MNLKISKNFGFILPLILISMGVFYFSFNFVDFELHDLRNSIAGMNSISGKVTANTGLVVINNIPHITNLRDLTYYSHETINLSEEFNYHDSDSTEIFVTYHSPFDATGYLVPSNILGTQVFYTNITLNDGYNVVNETVKITIINLTKPLGPIHIILQRPYQNENVIISKEDTILFSYDVISQYPINYCELFVEYTFSSFLIEWKKFAYNNVIENGRNAFEIDNLGRGDYDWNVRCFDILSQSNFSASNNTFEVNFESTIFTPISSTESISQITKNYNYDLEIEDVYLYENEIKKFNFSIENYQDPITGVFVNIPLSWIKMDSSYKTMISNNAIFNFIVNTSNIKSGIYPTYVLVETNQINLKKTFNIHVLKKSEIEIPGIISKNNFEVTKKVQVSENNSKVSFEIINYENKTFQNITLVDLILINEVFNLTYDKSIFSFGNTSKLNFSFNLTPYQKLNLSYQTNIIEPELFLEPKVIIQDVDPVINLEIKFVSLIDIDIDKKLSVTNYIIVYLVVIFIISIVLKNYNQKLKNKKLI